MVADKKATLLFCHGGGFCKQVWNPIIRRVEEHFKALDIELSNHTIDFSYHGSKRDASVPATLHLENPTAPWVEHPAMHWATYAADEIEREVEAIKQDGEDRPLLIGIGHSMGAASLWRVETRHPGTFDALVLFEPICNFQNAASRINARTFLVNVTLKRTAMWPSMELAQKELLSLRNFRHWDPESLREYVGGSLVEVEENNGKQCVLVCTPEMEASLYCAPILRLPFDEMIHVQARVFLESGARSHLFFREDHDALMATHPELYRIGEPIPNASHALILEVPDAIATRVIAILTELIGTK